MAEEGISEVAAFLESGRKMIGQASQAYGRQLSASEYWWLGVGLAASTLAALNDRTYATGRIDQLIDQLGQAKTESDWLQRFVEELAELDAEGLLWPLYQRDASGVVVPTEVQLTPSFDAQAAYYLALGHIAVASALNEGESEIVNLLATAIGDTVESGLTRENADIILQALQSAMDE
ncbi:MAG: hypothetical protein ACM3XM_00585 [Mycobacterium leprae]